MSTQAITPLRQRMIEDMTARKLCAGTQRGHIRPRHSRRTTRRRDFVPWRFSAAGRRSAL
jgi:hypothetical protein